MKEEKDESLIHLKFSYSETLNSKRDLLYSKRNLLAIEGTMRELGSLKEKKLELNLRLHKIMKEVLIGIRGIQKTVPALKIPKILRDEFHDEGDFHEENLGHSKKVSSRGEIDYGEDIEAQIRDIQKKLKSIQE
jgi:hypothetical protein|tara:strand:- start:1527 stop:1928 length:402 start_codon:yes stop_codon:yes gene_type:complete